MAHLYKDAWNQWYSNTKEATEPVLIDYWLDTFEDVIDPINTMVIDLGCGLGNDTLYLSKKNKSVIACDYSEEALRTVEKRVPQAKTMLLDITESLPFKNNCTELVIADLSLHYFAENVTFEVIGEIKRILSEGGCLLCRLNSTNEYGAMLGEALGKNFYRTNRMTKRFFDEESIQYFFDGWTIVYIKEEEVNRYSRPKVLWTCRMKVNK